MLTLIVVLTVALSALFVRQTASSIVANQQVALQHMVIVLADRISEPLESGDKRETAASLESILSIADVVSVRIVDRDGNQIAGSEAIDDETVTDGRMDSLWSLILGRGFGHVFMGRTLSATVPVARNNAVIGHLTIHQETGQIRSELVRIMLMAAAFSVLVGMVATAAAMWLQTMITRPLHQLMFAMDVAGRTGRYSETIPENGPAETALIARTFNAMITRIGSRDKALQERQASLESKVLSRTQDLEIARDSAESANRAKSAFLATMSHEIRTPLNGMLVMAELLANSDLDPKRKRYAQVIESSGRALVNIINDVLDLSKIEAGAMTFEPIVVCPRRMVSDVLDLFAEKAASKCIDLAGYVDPSVPELVEADPVRIKQILSNFVNNAIKFTAKGYVFIEMTKEGDELCLSVTDTGVGIKEENHAHIFEPFSQEDLSTHREYGGSGLGLAICKKLAEATGGSIGFESAPDEGSMFFVRLPCQLATSGQDQVDWNTVSTTVIEGRRIVVLTESLLGLKVLAQTLVDVGVIVTEIDNEAITAEALEGADLIIGGPSDVMSMAEWLSPEDAHRMKDQMVCAAPPSDSKREWLRKNGHVSHVIDLPAIRDQVVRDIAWILDPDSVQKAENANVQALGPTYPELRALVADDNAVNREVMAAILEQFEITPTFACDGSEAVEAYRSGRFDIVFMDISMPVMDGEDAKTHIRAFERDIGGARCPIFALTAHGATMDGISWEERDFDGYIGKPVRVFDIRSVLARISADEDGEQSHYSAEEASSEHSEPSADLVFDWTTIDGLTRTMSIVQRQKLQTTVLGIYCADAPDRLIALREAVQSGDRGEVRMTSHALKSMSLNVGAVRVGRQSAAIENAAREGEDLPDTASLDALGEALTETLAIINERIKAAA